MKKRADKTSKVWWYVAALVIVIAAAILVFYLKVNPELAPLGCTNRYDTETVCRGHKVCQKTSGTITEYSWPDSNGGCATGWSLVNLDINVPMDDLCAIARNLAGKNSQNGPPACATGCRDLGVEKFEDRTTQVNCCISGTERTCVDPIGPGD